MNYTETYRRIYSIISKVDIPHEKKHTATLRIADALNDILIYTKRQFPEVMDEILMAVQDFCDDVKIGGYDLDDKGFPIGKEDIIYYKDGTSFAGEKNNK